MCNNTCHPQCSGSGMTGERDPDSCACICLEGTNAETCACPEGYIYVDGQCQRLYCIGNNSSGYTCYLNGKECGTECSDSKGESCVAGYCYPEQCVENLGSDFSYNTETYWTHSSGCESPNYDLMCSPVKSDPIHWYCKKKIYGTPADDSCCRATSFGKCTIGTCDETDCDLVNGNYAHISYLTWGCTITHEDKTIYCAPHFNEWACMSSPLISFTNFCGTCTAEQLKNRECGDCFNDFSCPKDPNTNLNMYLDKTLNRCVLSDESFSCDLRGFCYHGKTDKKCGESCDLYTPSSCRGGLCQDNQCPPGTTYQHFPFSNFSGCEKTLDANHTLACFSQSGGYQRFQCYYTTKNGDGTYANALRCADTDCNLDGTGCKYYYMDECAPIDSETGKKYCLHGNPLTEECICKDGVETNGYCCPPNHTYLNGGCTLINCPDGQVADEGGICKTACKNNAEVLDCICSGTTHTNQFNAKICCESGYTWNENTQTCQ